MIRTGERVFRGRRNDEEDWYVVDPATPDPAASIRDWRARHAPTNHSTARRVTAGVVGWSAFLIVTIGPTALAVVLIPQLFGGVVVIIGVVSFIAGLVCALFLSDAIVPSPPPVGAKPPDVVLLEPEMIEWARGAASIQDLWELNQALRRTRDVLAALDHWGIYYYDHDVEDARRPDRVIEETIEPALRTQFETERARLLEVSARVSFTPPEDAVADPEPMSGFSG